MINKQLRLSCLGHTWLIDIDGTICEHNSHLRGGDRLLPGVKEAWAKIPDEDIVILLSARDVCFKDKTEEYLSNCGLRFNYSIFGLPKGERIVVNDKKPGGLDTAVAINLQRDTGLRFFDFLIDQTL